jgi:hypothetical protein
MIHFKYLRYILRHKWYVFVECCRLGIPWRGAIIPLRMPLKYRKEMLADWRGAGRAITGKNETRQWYEKNKDNMMLHPETQRWIEANL